MKTLLIGLCVMVVLSCNDTPKYEMPNEHLKNKQKELMQDAMREVVYQWQTSIDGNYDWQLMPNKRFVQALFMPGASEPYIVTRLRRPGEIELDTFYIICPSGKKYTIAESKESLQ